MPDKTSRFHKGAGGNIPGGKEKSISGGRPRQQKGQPQAATSSSIDEYPSADSVLDDEDASMSRPFLSDSQLADFHEALADSERRSGPARKRAQSTQAEQERQRRSLQPRIKTTPNSAIPSSISRNGDKSTAPPAPSPSSPLSPTNSEEWENLPEPTSTTPLPSTPPFPGTWSAALHDTTAALTQVSYASRSFGAALTKSGIGKASRSVGTAALSSTNQAALAVASWGIKKTGT
ncbi:hypothetical protein ACET3X_000008 [Alternaria dauci]|uniref:Uncharacterized protein n=1 Tax=Alternaria dauci TaxID=48095 RepID=A0ABR3UTA3_9PLEO